MLYMYTVFEIEIKDKPEFFGLIQIAQPYVLECDGLAVAAGKSMLTLNWD